MVRPTSGHDSLTRSCCPERAGLHATCKLGSLMGTWTCSPRSCTVHATSAVIGRNPRSIAPAHSFAGLRPTTFTHSRPPARSLFCGPLDCAHATNGFFSFLRRELSRGQCPAGRQERESDRPPIACFFCGSRPGLPAGGRGSPFFVTAFLLSRHPAAPPVRRPAEGATPGRPTTRRFR